MLPNFQGFEHLLENLGIGGIKFDTSHTFVQHKNTDGSFQELHDSLKVHDHFHKRFVREANKMKKRSMIVQIYLVQAYVLY